MYSNIKSKTMYFCQIILTFPTYNNQADWVSLLKKANRKRATLHSPQLLIDLLECFNVSLIWFETSVLCWK